MTNRQPHKPMTKRQKERQKHNEARDEAARREKYASMIGQELFNYYGAVGMEFETPDGFRIRQTKAWCSLEDWPWCKHRAESLGVEPRPVINGRIVVLGFSTPYSAESDPAKFKEWEQHRRAGIYDADFPIPPSTERFYIMHLDALDLTVEKFLK